MELPHHYRIEVAFDVVPIIHLPIKKPVINKISAYSGNSIHKYNFWFKIRFKNGGEEIKTFKLSAPGNLAVLALLMCLLSYLYKISVSQEIIDMIIIMIRNLIIAGQRGSFYNRNLNPDKISQTEIAC